MIESLPLTQSQIKQIIQAFRSLSDGVSVGIRNIGVIELNKMPTEITGTPPTLNGTHKPLPDGLEIYQSFNIDWGAAATLKYQNNYLQIEYWLVRHPDRSYCRPHEKQKRYIEAARHLYFAGDLARLQQLCSRVPHIRGVKMFRNELEKIGCPRCCDCKYWSGLSEKKFLICAVNPTIVPSEEAMRKADHRLAYARHDCPDFESAITAFTKL